MPGQRDMLFTSKKKKEKNVFHKTVETVKIKFNKQVVVFKSKWQELKPTKSINVLTSNIFSGSVLVLLIRQENVLLFLNFFKYQDFNSI